MGLYEDVSSRMDQLANDREKWERIWIEIATYCLPDHARFEPGTGTLNAYVSELTMREPTSVERGRQRYDDTAMRAVDRLASGMESLVTPQNEKWHGLAKTDPLAAEATDEEKEYFDTYRDYMFAVRYDARSGFIGAHQKALRSAISLGSGVVFVEENIGKNQYQVPVLYRYLPLNECYLAVDAQGEPDTLFRKFLMTARQMVQKFTYEKCHPNVQRSFDSPATMDQRYTMIHAVFPRAEAGGYGATNLKAPWASIYIDRDNNHVMGQSGFFEFPFIVYYWQPVENMPYAQSPVMLALSDIKGLNSVRKTALRGLQQFIDPPMATAHDGFTNRPNLNPRAMNYGAISPNGQLRIQPIMTNQRPDFIQEIIEAERKNINDSLYITLFQILSQASPDMTATEAMIRANEKGELLGPAGGKIQHAMAREVDRLAGILERKGAMRPGAALQPPQSLIGKSFGARFTSPLDRLRRAKEGIGIQQTLETVLPLIQADPDVIDNYDLDYVARALPDINGAPQKMLKRVEERDAARAQKQQMRQAQAGLGMAQQAGDAAKNIVPAVGQASAILGNGPVGAPAGQ